MVHFTALIKKFGRQGEKTGWTYIQITDALAQTLKPGNNASFRVKGQLDHYAIEKTAVMPMGDGSFIFPLNATIRKHLKKEKGATVDVCLKADNEPIKLDADFMDCLRDEPTALKFFESLATGHRNYFSKWIEAARTEPTKAKRIAMAVNGLAKGWGFPQMIRANKKEKSSGDYLS